MRWLQIDPLGQVTGPNGYEMESNGPVDSVDPLGLFKLFGQQWVAPWDPNASWNLWGGIQQYGSAAGVAAAGTGSGALSGATTGGLTGAAVGGLATGGPGALPGAGAGALAGGLGGGMSGFISSMFADDVADAAWSGGIEGAIAGPLTGGPAALLKVRKIAKAAQAAKCAPQSCFPADTPVTTEDGLKPIQSVRRGDQVLGRAIASKFP